jgi:hypothetical protein
MATAFPLEGVTSLHPAPCTWACTCTCPSTFFLPHSPDSGLSSRSVPCHDKVHRHSVNNINLITHSTTMGAEVLTKVLSGQLRGCEVIPGHAPDSGACWQSSWSLLVWRTPSPILLPSSHSVLFQTRPCSECLEKWDLSPFHNTLQHRSGPSGQQPARWSLLGRACTLVLPVW